MKITKIEKKKRLYLLEFDENDKLYVTEDTVVRFMLSKGMSITEEELEEIKIFTQFSYGKNLALYHISFKQRTETEIRKYLAEHDIDEKIIPQIIQNLKEENWIDDYRYVESFLNQNLFSGDKGPYILKQKLIQKGIAENLIDDELEKMDFSELLDKTAQKLYQKYASKLPQQALQNKLRQNLVNKGFTYNDVSSAISHLEMGKNKENEEELLYRELDKQYRKYSRKYEGYDLKQRLIQALSRKGFGFDEINRVLRDYL